MPYRTQTILRSWPSIPTPSPNERKLDSVICSLTHGLYRLYVLYVARGCLDQSQNICIWLQRIFSFISILLFFYYLVAATCTQISRQCRRSSDHKISYSFFSERRCTGPCDNVLRLAGPKSKPQCAEPDHCCRCRWYGPLSNCNWMLSSAGRIDFFLYHVGLIVDELLNDLTEPNHIENMIYSILY